MTFARLVLTAATNDALPESAQFHLPPRPAAHSIVQFYMTNIYSLFPCFSETSLLTTLDDVYQQDGRFIKNSDYFLFYMVLAIGSSAQCQILQDQRYADGVKFISKALEYSDSALAPGYIVQIQSLLLLTQYSMLDPAHFDSWHLIGFTARAAVDLGLHQDPPTSSAYEKAALDMRRKLFYCVYSLDRYVVLELLTRFILNPLP
jgi:Fungal specific transcription factor domain